MHSTSNISCSVSIIVKSADSTFICHHGHLSTAELALGHCKLRDQCVVLHTGWPIEDLAPLTCVMAEHISSIEALATLKPAHDQTVELVPFSATSVVRCFRLQRRWLMGQLHQRLIIQGDCVSCTYLFTACLFLCIHVLQSIRKCRVSIYVYFMILIIVKK